MGKGRNKDTHVKHLAPLAGPVEKPRCPDHLEGLARREFLRLAREIDSLTTKDEHALTIYCKAYARWRLAEDRLDQHGCTQDYKGFERQSPWVQISNEASKVMRELLREFGLTPAARKKLMEQQPTREPDAFDSFITRKNAG